MRNKVLDQNIEYVYKTYGHVQVYIKRVELSIFLRCINIDTDVNKYFPRQKHVREGPDTRVRQKRRTFYDLQVITKEE